MRTVAPKAPTSSALSVAAKRIHSSLGALLIIELVTLFSFIALGFCLTYTIADAVVELIPQIDSREQAKLREQLVLLDKGHNERRLVIFVTAFSPVVLLTAFAWWNSMKLASKLALAVHVERAGATQRG